MLRAGECNCLPSHKEESFAVHQEETMFQFFPTKKPLDLLWLLSVLSKLHNQRLVSTLQSTPLSPLWPSQDRNISTKS